MTRHRRSIWWALLAGFVGLTVLFLTVELEVADQLASVLGVFIGLAGLALTIHTVGQGTGAARPAEPPPTAAPSAQPRRSGPDDSTGAEPGLVDSPPRRPRRLSASARLYRSYTDVDGGSARVEPACEAAPLTATPEDSIFSHAVDATCDDCGAVYRMGLKRKELLPPPDADQWILGVLGGLLTIGLGVLFCWTLREMYVYAFVEGHAGGSTFTTVFFWVVAVGAVGGVLNVARGTRNLLRPSDEYSQLMAGPQTMSEPLHAHVSGVHRD